MTISLEWSGTGKAHQIAMSIRLLSNVYFLPARASEQGNVMGMAKFTQVDAVHVSYIARASC